MGSRVPELYAPRNNRVARVSEALVARSGAQVADLGKWREQFVAAHHQYGNVDRGGYDETPVWPVLGTDQIATLRQCASRTCQANGSKLQSRCIHPFSNLLWFSSNGVVESSWEVTSMVAKQDGWTDLVKILALSTAILVPLVGLILYQGSDLRSEIRGLRAEVGGEVGGLRTEVGGLRTEVSSLHTEVSSLHTEVSSLRGEIDNLNGEFDGLRETVRRLEVAVARIEARDSIRLALAERFSTSGEGASYGGPMIAADILLARVLPEIDAVLSTLDKDAQTELAEDLWEDRANILARAAPP